MGWCKLPVPCPVCGRHLNTGKLVHPAGGVRCTHCAAVVYWIYHAPTRTAFVVEITFRELEVMQDREMEVDQVLGYLGATFPYQQTPTPARSRVRCSRSSVGRRTT